MVQRLNIDNTETKPFLHFSSDIKDKKYKVILRIDFIFTFFLLF